MLHSGEFQGALAQIRDSLDRFVASLLRPERHDRAVLIALAAFLLIWTLYAVITHLPQQLHADMLEAATLAREPAWGYAKHPPLSIWVAGLWFAVFPPQPWAFYLLAIVIPTIGLWASWRLWEGLLTTDKRALGLALLMLVPFYNFHAQRYNANTILIPLWALTTLWFVRAYRTRSPFHAALAGLGAAGAMLGKYWSIFLLAALVLAALLGPHRRAFFRSPAPWIVVAAGALALAPHVHWLFVDGFMPFRYATALHVAAGVPWAQTLRYCADVFAFAIIPIAFVALALRPSASALRDLLLPPPGERRLAALIFWGGLLLPVPVALATGSLITGLWAMPAYALLPVILLSSPQVVASQPAVRAGVALAIAFPLLALLASPLVAWIIGLQRPAPVDYQALAAAAEQVWRNTTDRPLRLVAGDAELAFGSAFFMDSRPVAIPSLWFQHGLGAAQDRVRRDGLLAICAPADAPCVALSEGLPNPLNVRRAIIQVPGGSRVKRVAPNPFVVIVAPPAP